MNSSISTSMDTSPGFPELFGYDAELHSTLDIALTERVEVFAFPRGQESLKVLVIYGPSISSLSGWLSCVMDQLGHLLSLEENWDSYGAKRVSFHSAVAMLNLIPSIAAAESPVPTLVPTNVGGIQLEWHENNIDLEIEIGPRGKPQVYVFDASSETEFEGEDLEKAMEALDRIRCVN